MYKYRPIIYRCYTLCTIWGTKQNPDPGDTYARDSRVGPRRSSRPPQKQAFLWQKPELTQKAIIVTTKGIASHIQPDSGCRYGFLMSNSRWIAKLSGGESTGS